MFSELVEKTRTIRRYDMSKVITDTDMTEILECARKCASAGNLQRLRYAILNSEEAEETFSAISLGGLLPKEKKPTRDVAPISYVVLFSKESEPDSNLLIDVGIAAQTIALAAAEKGIGSCMIRNFNKEYFSSLESAVGYYPILVIALGYPLENAQIVDVNEGDNLKYYKNDSDVNIVPKLTLSSLLLRKSNKM